MAARQCSVLRFSAVQRRNAGCVGRLLPTARSMSRRKCGRRARARMRRHAPRRRLRPPAIPRRNRRPSQSFCRTAPSCRSICGSKDRHRTRLPAWDIRCRCAWLSIDTTRSRRSSKTFWNFGMKSCGAVQRFDARPLRDRRRIGHRLRLQLRHRLDERLGAAAIADAPAGHRIGLRHAVHRQRAVHKGAARPGRWWRTRSRHRPDARTCRRSAPRHGDGRSSTSVSAFSCSRV